MYDIIFSKQANKDAKRIKGTYLASKVLQLLEITKNDPLTSPPPFEKLIGELQGYYSRRINSQHRLVYQIYEKEKKVKIIRMWTHYE